ncbi:oligopeptide ABC transporter permease OppB [Spiroplasma endosymbiont of Aspidapion aeneum]|uniref:oligopeptide ABC transporter permease OppB n=1 Tax=Spiroplasma endosymbiont of Aspidapion aeneum TaxID=3066276 RepID=UPI00313C7894
MEVEEKKQVDEENITMEGLDNTVISQLQNLISREGDIVSRRSKGIGTYLAKIGFKFHLLNQKRQDYFLRKPLLGYSIKRLIFAMITFYLAIAIVYIMISSVVSNSTIMQNVDLKEYSQEGGVGGPKYMEILNGKKNAMGLDLPLFQQVLNWWLNISFIIPFSYVNGHYVHQWFYLGTVLSTNISTEGSSVWDTLRESMPISFKIGFLGFLSAFTIGIPLGILCARYKNKSPDKVINTISIFLQSVPAIIVVSIVFVLAVSEWNASATYETGGFSTKIYAFITMFILVLPQIVIDVRRYVVDEMTAEYTNFAKSKGLGSGYIFVVHVFRVAGVRVLRIVPTALILSLFGSSILTETYWNVHGMSRLILLGVTYRDLYICLGYITISAIFGIITSLFADLLTAWLDPRVSLIK